MKSVSPARLAPWLVVFAASVAGGWVLGRRLIEKPSQAPARNLSAPVASRSHPWPVNPASPAGQWIGRVKEGTRADFPRLFEELLIAFPLDDSSRESAISYFFAEWLAKDPDAVMAFAEQHQKENGPALIRLALEVMARGWPEKAAALLFESGKSSLPENLRDHALSELAEHHPDVYLKMDPVGKTSGWRDAMIALAERDPAAAAVYFGWTGPKGDSAPSVDTNLIVTLASTWQRLDSAAARRWIDSIPDAGNRRIALQGWLATLGRHDPAAALKELSGLDLGGDAGEPWPDDEPLVTHWGDARLEIAGRFAIKDFAAAFAALPELAASFSDGGGISEKNRVRDWMVKAKSARLPSSPEAFVNEVDAMSRVAGASGGDTDWWQNAQREFLPGYVASWSVEECLTAARQRSPSSDTASDVLLREILHRAAQASPATALEAMPNLPAEFQPALSRSLLEFLPPELESQRAALLSRLPAAGWNSELANVLQQDAEGYARIIKSLPEETTRATRANFAAQWAQRDPEAAAEWVTSLPESARETWSVAQAWARTDEAAASAWVQSLATGPARDEALSGLVSGLTSSDPEAAWHQASALADPAKRHEAFTGIGKVWGTEAPAEFQDAFFKEAGVEFPWHREEAASPSP